MWLHASGFININFIQMVLLLATRPDGLFEVFHSNMELIMMRPSVQLLGLRLSGLFLSITTSRHWSIHHLDVKNAFLHGQYETAYCQQPPGFVDPAHPDHVCLMQRCLYGLK